MSEIDIRRRLGVDRQRAWAALTDPALLASWFWPERFATEVAVDLRVGGGYRIRSEVGGLAVSGDYVAIDPPERLVFTWLWDDDPDETLVTIELAEDGDGTLLHLRHERFDDERVRSDNEAGWESCLARFPDGSGDGR